MQDSVVFLSISAFVVGVFGVSLYLAFKGSETAKYFLWVWAAILIIAVPLQIVSATTLEISSLAAFLMLLVFVYVLYLMYANGIERLKMSHEETRRVLADLNTRIDDERKMLSRLLHDEVNSDLLACRPLLERLLPMVRQDDMAAGIVGELTELINEAYKSSREIIKNTRIEIIDSIGFPAAVESLVAHYTNFFDKPTISIEHNLPKRPPIEEKVAVNAYKIIREAIFNAIKHANAKHVTVEIVGDNKGNFKVAIVDDGVGLKELPFGSSVAGIGLIDMRERARVLGATLKIRAANPSDAKHPGTKVSFSFSGGDQ